MKIVQELATDVLIIGGGGAGLRAALAAADENTKVLVVTKGPIGRSGITLTAAGGMQAPFHPDDSPEQYFEDTIRFGYELGDRNLAQALAEDACKQVEAADKYGVRFVRDRSGKYSLGQFPGQSQPRNLFVKGGGIGLVSALARACRDSEHIQIQDDFFVTGLVTGNLGGQKSIAGAIGLNLRTGELTYIKAKALIMATGGCQWLWETNDCPTDATGDGVIYAYRSGAFLVDMEMILFYPSIIVWPPSLKGAFAHYEFLATDVLDGNVYDREGRPVFAKPLPVRDEAMRLMAEKLSGGLGSEHGGLFWYVGDSPYGQERVCEKLNIAQYNYMKKHGIDPATTKIEVAPGAHYLLGGIHIDEVCRTSLPGLFATPECAGNFDGANRLAGSGIAATQVFGARAGLAAQEWARQNAGCEADSDILETEISRINQHIAVGRQGKSQVKELRDRLRQAVQQYAGVRRNEAGLKKLLQITKEIAVAVGEEKVADIGIYPQQFIDLLQLENLCEAATLIAGSALLRQESRGHHFRSDFPLRDDENWLTHTCAMQTKGGPVFAAKPIA